MFCVCDIIKRGREQIIPHWGIIFLENFTRPHPALSCHEREKHKHMRTKTSVFLLIITIAVIACISAFYGWFLIQSDRIATGTAKPYFPYSDYSIDELNKMYPQTMNENVVTTQTPEQTHTKFISALKAQDFDEAVKCCFFEGDWSKAKMTLEKVQSSGGLSTMIKDIEKIDKELLLDTVASYSYATTENGEKIGHTINFVKDENGVWRIKSL